MARRKKTRKIGQIGVRKDPNAPKKPTSTPRKKKHTGLRSGNRNSELLKKQESKHQTQAIDKRLGSKTPIKLTSEVTKQKFRTPQEELESIENDATLQALLDKQDEGVELTKKEQSTLDTALARHQLLCELLGINDDFEDDEEV